MTANLERFRVSVRRYVSLLSGIALTLLVIVATVPGGHLSLAIYTLSFWHYYLYWLAYCLGAVSPAIFRRDAIAMKTVSLIALSVAYLAAPPDLLSLAVVTAGFLLNAVAARALGAERTYYGHEVAGLPRLHITAFPYSWISHPMLVGNIAAFGGTLINADFRREWWPLACAHVAMNLGLLFMELGVTPQRRSQLHSTEGGPGPGPIRPRIPAALRTVAATAAVGGVLGWTLGSWGPWGTHALLGTVMGAGMAIHAAVTYFCYSSPGSAPVDGRDVQAENSR